MEISTGTSNFAKGGALIKILSFLYQDLSAKHCEKRLVKLRPEAVDLVSPGPGTLMPASNVMCDLEA